MKSVLERMEENDTERKVANFQAWQKEDYEFKRAFAEEAAWRFFEDPEINGNCYVAVGGLDSITLLCFYARLGLMCQLYRYLLWRIKASKKFTSNWACRLYRRSRARLR